MATSYTNRTKPSTSYTARTKPTVAGGGTTGSPMGLLLALTYSSSLPSPSYTNRTKPTTTYTNRTKP